jgi:hypothetical protein
MRYDLYYIKNRSLWLDVTIIVRTFAIMLLGSESSKVGGRVPPRLATTASTAIEDLAPGVPEPVPVPAYDTAYVAAEATKVVGVAR